jgi:acetyl esterase/lipase
MALSFDPEIEVAFKAAAEAVGELPPPPPRGDALMLRAGLDGLMAEMLAAAVVAPGVTKTTYHTVAADGTQLNLHWFTTSKSRPGSAVCYIHGGGMICGSVDLYNAVISDYVAASGVPMLAVSYRLAPEHPHPTPVEDAYAGLAWLFDHAAELGADPSRIAVMGDSAGGGIAAGVALLARDRGLKLARQILIYPMLDDRNQVPEEALVPFANWTYDNNFTGWSALLGTTFGSDNVPAAAAPSRATDLRGIAPLYMEVGELDIFRLEDIDYARNIAAAGVSIELHVHPGAPHGFERMAPESDVAKRAMADRLRVLAAL